jgi:hypothetical protein
MSTAAFLLLAVLAQLSSPDVGLQAKLLFNIGQAGRPVSLAPLAGETTGLTATVRC